NCRFLFGSWSYLVFQPPQRKWCPEGWTRFGCSCYFKSTEKKWWYESRTDCRNKGADLVSINSKEEQVSVFVTVCVISDVTASDLFLAAQLETCSLTSDSSKGPGIQPALPVWTVQAFGSTSLLLFYINYHGS
uniref:C-type lectin domain-containing protein n=1 Tax=Mastacembelus armatus TaxID=205130 RepID=A0A3Q3N3Q5_9TELE